MKTLLLFLVRIYISTGLFFYFKKIEVRKHSSIAKDKPILFIANHQNALLDPLLIATTCGRYSYFLTRAQVFKKPLVAKLLKLLKLLPVYRVRDGWKTITQNNSIFSKCVSLLNKNEAITIFPEGNHNLKRTVRPLSKGFTRIITAELEANSNTDLLLIPIGLNYTSAIKCPDNVMVYYGNPIKISKYKLEDKSQTVNAIKAEAHKALTKLTTHIESDNYANTLAKLNALNVDFLNPEAVNNCIESSFKKCKSNTKSSVGFFSTVFKVFLIISCLVPYLIWKKITKPKIKEIEFISTFRFLIAITLVPIWLLLVAVILWFSFSATIALAFIISTLILALLAVKL